MHSNNNNNNNNNNKSEFDTNNCVQGEGKVKEFVVVTPYNKSVDSCMVSFFKHVLNAWTIGREPDSVMCKMCENNMRKLTLS